MIIRNARAMIVVLSLLTSTEPALAAIDLPALQQKLTTTGLEGEIHGIYGEQSLFVFTFRNPTDFFDFLHISLVPKSPAIATQLAGLHRHDRVRIKGDFLKNKSPQPHAEITALELVRAYDPGVTFPEYRYETKIPADLPRNEQGLGEALFLVHAVHGDGKILVVEYRDAVLPVFVKDPAQSAHLFRNDVIRLAFRLQADPDAPVHLRPRADVAQPIQLVEAAVSKHGKPADLTGPLVFFPKSPQVSIDVYALHEAAEGGATRQYTLVNFESAEAFRAIREKLAAAWARDPSNHRNGRNKLIHNRIKVRAKGTFNCVDPNQANVQILLKSADDLEILE